MLKYAGKLGLLFTILEIDFGMSSGVAFDEPRAED